MRNVPMRTTLDIDGPILSELKVLQEREGKSLGRLVSDLLAHALKEGAEAAPTSPPVWNAKPMHARFDLADKEALHRVLDE